MRKCQKKKLSKKGNEMKEQKFQRNKILEVEKKKEIKRNTKPSKTGNKDETIDENEITALIEEKMEN